MGLIMLTRMDGCEICEKYFEISVVWKDLWWKVEVSCPWFLDPQMLFYSWLISSNLLQAKAYS